MALFKKRKDASVDVDDAQKAAVGQDASTDDKAGKSKRAPLGGGVSSVLLRPRITEKAMAVTDQHVYVFEVAPHASKKQIAEAVKEVYNVTPVQVRTSAIPYKKINSPFRRHRGVSGGGKKAYVYLKGDDRIELM